MRAPQGAAGLPEGEFQRRVPGLRREEVAQLAAISVDYHARLEQGRVPASAAVLATLVAALRLDDDQQAYLYEVAGKTDARPRRRRARQTRGPRCVTDPTIRSLHEEWEQDARDAVAALRMEAAADPEDPELARLVGELAVLDPDFRTWWAERRVDSATYGTKRYRHHLVGELTLDCDIWSSPDGSGQRLMVLTAEPGTPSDEALRILSSWTATEKSRAR